MPSDQSADEWMLQARHDLGTAHYLFDGGRFPYAAFFAHLAAEKALKAVCRQRRGNTPPVSHDLRYLADAARLELPDDQHAHIEALADANVSVLTLYPDRLDAEDVSATEAESRDLLNHAEALLKAIRLRMRAP